MRKPSWIAVPLPLLAAHETGTVFSIKDWVLFLLIGAAFALGWICATLSERLRSGE